MTTSQAKKPAKVKLTKAEIQRRVVEGGPDSPSGNNIAAARWKARSNQQLAYYSSIGTIAHRLQKKEGMSLDAAWAKAFKSMPRYSTRQKVRQNWNVFYGNLLQNR